MPDTQGLNHLGLTVHDLTETTKFFVEILDWELLATDDSYPRTTVSDGQLRLTLWQATIDGPRRGFNRHDNVGLHHLAIEVESEAKLTELNERIQGVPGVAVEFAPEPLGGGPRKHMMFAEPGGIRLELIWPGT
ncbi:MAG: VOC family protein [Pseudomonadota bacterium]